MRFSSVPQALTVAAVLLVGTAEARADDAPRPAPASVAGGKRPTASRPVAAPVGKPASRARRREKAAVAVLAEGTPVATYPSFRLLDDGSTRVTVEVSRKVAVTEHKARGRVVYSLAGVAVPGSNTQLALPTGFFRTPVERIAVVGEPGGADLVIELRDAVDPTYRVLDTPRGSVVLQVDFPRVADAASTPEPAAARRTVETKRIETKATVDD
jgi:hypothetical protein